METAVVAETFSGFSHFFNTFLCKISSTKTQEMSEPQAKEMSNNVQSQVEELEHKELNKLVRMTT